MSLSPLPFCGEDFALVHFDPASVLSDTVTDWIFFRFEKLFIRGNKKRSVVKWFILTDYAIRYRFVIIIRRSIFVRFQSGGFFTSFFPLFMKYLSNIKSRDKCENKSLAVIHSPLFLLASCRWKSFQLCHYFHSFHILTRRLVNNISLYSFLWVFREWEVRCWLSIFKLRKWRKCKFSLFFSISLFDLG